MATTAELNERWRKLLTEGHAPLRNAHRMFRHLPGPPRCKMCHNPFGGIGGKLVALAGFKPSRKNPNLCSRCCDDLPPGGVEIDIAVLFADVRGSTALAEGLTPSAYAALLNRFYNVATEALIGHDAIIDKLIGDEVMALFIPGICGPDFRRRAAAAARSLLRAVGYGAPDGPLVPIGTGVYSGLTYVGNVGGGVVDFTALGDTVNTAARLASAAKAGEVLLGEEVHASGSGEFFSNLEQKIMVVQGKEAPLAVRAWQPFPDVSPSLAA
jgi:adenylate cyclase